MQEKGSLSIHSENLFPIIKKWLYSDQDIFIRELVSNAADAIAKIKKLSSLGEVQLPEGEEFSVHVTIDAEGKTITISDNGIGMTDEEVRKYINQIAFSGAAEFLEKYKDASEDPIIRQQHVGLDQGITIDRIELADNLPSLFQHGQLILTYGNGCCFKRGDIRRLTDRICEESNRNAGFKVAHLDFGFHRRISL